MCSLSSTFENNQSQLAVKGFCEISALNQQGTFPQRSLSIPFPILQGGLVQPYPLIDRYTFLHAEAYHWHHWLELKCTDCQFSKENILFITANKSSIKVYCVIFALCVQTPCILRQNTPQSLQQTLPDLRNICLSGKLHDFRAVYCIYLSPKEMTPTKYLPRQIGRLCKCERAFS